MKNPLGKLFAKNTTKENPMDDNAQDESINENEAQISDELADLELEITYIPIAQLNPYEQNSRTHSEEQIQELAANIRDNGMIDPILVQKNTIIYGHARVLAMMLLGREKICSIEVSHLTKKQIINVVISNNKLALNAGWDYSILGMEAHEYIDLGGQMSELGFDDSEGDMILNGWSSDIDLTGAGSLEDMLASILVKCDEKDKDDLHNTILKAVNESGIESVEVRVK